MTVQTLTIIITCSTSLTALCCLWALVGILNDLHKAPAVQLRPSHGLPGIYRAGAYRRYLRTRPRLRMLLYCSCFSFLLGSVFLYLTTTFG